MESINRFPDLDRERPTVISAGSRHGEKLDRLLLAVAISGRRRTRFG